MLKPDDGHVGFDGPRGAEAMLALVGGAAVIELTNSPEWFQPEASEVPNHVRRCSLKGAVTCTLPDPLLIQELETVSSNRKRVKQNATLERHGRNALPLTPTHFDDWITSHWWFSDFGAHARCFGRTSDLAAAPILRVAEELHVPVEHVASRSALPTW